MDASAAGRCMPTMLDQSSEEQMAALAASDGRCLAAVCLLCFARTRQRSSNCLHLGCAPAAGQVIGRSLWRVQQRHDCKRHVYLHVCKFVRPCSATSPRSSGCPHAVFAQASRAPRKVQIRPTHRATYRALQSSPTLKSTKTTLG